MRINVQYIYVGYLRFKSPKNTSLSQSHPGSFDYPQIQNPPSVVRPGAPDGRMVERQGGRVSQISKGLLLNRAG